MGKDKRVKWNGVSFLGSVNTVLLCGRERNEKLLGDKLFKRVLKLKFSIVAFS